MVTDMPKDPYFTEFFRGGPWLLVAEHVSAPELKPGGGRMSTRIPHIETFVRAFSLQKLSLLQALFYLYQQHKNNQQSKAELSHHQAVDHCDDAQAFLLARHGLKWYVHSWRFCDLLSLLT
ncbi:unnamed protein product [Fusarium graminearum]|uniref:Uncharacterized protein n=1 Tax=Gibberella zeae TaxID=5518 RepID=A0A4E9E529_GIBZA|nr:unnamed protein product [Fusarium graminearum]CAF3494503.1 unnamed protein product [Fusarium graminearum]CAG1976418.1 unnamed protein product [Fusarium graminearum]CAG2014259.1 unnamed protein product [Fusarium graminearum]